MNALGFGIIGLLFGLLFAIPFSSRGRRLAKTRKIEGDLIEDREALAQAEADLQGEDFQNFVHAYTFNTVDGYSEPFMLDLVQKLWADGYQAVYESVVSPGGEMRSFALKCPPDQVQSIQQFIAEMKS